MARGVTLILLLALVACSSARGAEEHGTRWLAQAGAASPGAVPAGDSSLPDGSIWSRTADLSSGAPWTREDTVRQGILTGLFLYDRQQTLRTVVERPEHFEEGNIFLGKHPSRRRVNAYNAILIPGHAWLMTKLDRPTRTIFQRVFIGVLALNTYRNHEVFQEHERTHFGVGFILPI